MNLNEKKEEFYKILNKIKPVLEKTGVNINPQDYDGMILKFLGTSNTLGEGKTNHIAITGNQRGMFPYLYPITYFEDDEDLKSFYVFKMPVILNKSNYNYIYNHEMLSEEAADEQINSFTTVLRSKRDNQLELSSQKQLEDSIFRDFREKLPSNSFLIILKQKNEVNYEIFGFPGCVDLKLLDQKRKFDLNNLKDKIEAVLNEELDIADFKKDLRDEFYEKYDFEALKKEFKDISDETNLNEMEENILSVINGDLDFDDFKEDYEEQFKDTLFFNSNCHKLEKILDVEELRCGLFLYNFKDDFYEIYSEKSYKTKTLVSPKFFEPNACKNGENILLYGVPGCGKSWTIKKDYCDDESRIERVVFHPDYTYSDFIGQILPKVNEGDLNYEFTPGPFTTILKRAYKYPTKKFYLVIEEINRGNAPAIFGDVFQLLDRVTDEESEYPIGTSEYGITHSDIARELCKDFAEDDDFAEIKVRIPPNLSIIATMNTSDQNVFTLDTAFQRRWNMRLIENSFENAADDFKTAKILDTGVTWKKFCEEINGLILEENKLSNSSEDKRLGVYFIHLNDLKSDVSEGSVKNSNKFSEKVLKYLWDDAFKFSRENIFNLKDFNSLESVIKSFNEKKGKERFNIFHPNVCDKIGLNMREFNSYKG